MKKIILLLSLLFVNFTSISQEIDYPIIHVDSFGKTVITMTIEQAQILDNKTDLLELIESANSQINNIDSLFLIVVNEKNIIIIKQDLQISELKLLTDNKDNQIENLQKRIIDYQLKQSFYKKELDNKDEEIKLHLSEINRLKGNMLFGVVGSGVIIATVVAILILK
jgi:hypothetical protein